LWLAVQIDVAVNLPGATGEPGKRQWDQAFLSIGQLDLGDPTPRLRFVSQPDVKLSQCGASFVLGDQILVTG
jgi:hypothetical protein